MATATCSAPAYRLATTNNLLIRLSSKGASAPFQLVNKVRFVYVGCSVSALYEEVNHLILLKNPGGKWIKRDLMG